MAEKLSPILRASNLDIDAILSMAEGLPRYAKPEGMYVWKKLTAEGGEFVDFVVSDIETTYPNGGMQDGYWYEMVEEGVDIYGFAGYTKMAVDYITYSSKQASTVKHAHSLGVNPKAGMILALDAVTENDGVTFAICSLNNANGSAALSSMRYLNSNTGFWTSVNAACPGFSSTDIQFGNNQWTSYYFIAGVKYLLLTWA